MDGPKIGLRMNKDGNVFYGWQLGLKLLSIESSFQFRGKTWLLVFWESYELLEAVPLDLLPKEFDVMVQDFLKKNKQ